MYQRQDRETLIDTTLVAGTAAYAAPVSANPALLGLTPRPNDRYAYGSCLLYYIGFTATPDGGAADCPPAKLVQVLKSMSLSYDGIQRRNNFSGLNVVRLSQQADENLCPDVVDQYIPNQALTAVGGPAAVSLCIVDPLGIQFPKGKRGAKHTGLIPLSSLKKGADLKVTCIGSTKLMANWTIANITLKVVLLVQEYDEPLEHVEVHEEFIDFAGKKATLPGVGGRLCSAAMVTDSEDADFVMPTAGSIEVDGALIRAGVNGADLVVEEDMGRQVGINDFLPAVCPIVTMTGRDLDEALPIRDEMKLFDFGEAHIAAGRTYGVLMRYSKKLTRDKQREIQIAHEVPAGLVDKFLDQMAERPNAEDTIGRVTVAMRAAS